MRRRVLLKTGMADARVLTRRTVRDGIVVEGPDASSWLQGQLSQDVAGMVEGESRLTLVLSPQGKVESFCRVTLLGGDRWLLDVERGFGSALVERLARFKIRVKVTLDQVTVACEERAGGGFESLGSPEIVTGDGGDEGGEGSAHRARTRPSKRRGSSPGFRASGASSPSGPFRRRRATSSST